jgi:hypothetical protein
VQFVEWANENEVPMDIDEEDDLNIILSVYGVNKYFDKDKISKILKDAQDVHNGNNVNYDAVALAIDVILEMENVGWNWIEDFFHSEILTNSTDFKMRDIIGKINSKKISCIKHLSDEFTNVLTNV